MLIFAASILVYYLQQGSVQQEHVLVIHSILIEDLAQLQ